MSETRQQVQYIAGIDGGGTRCRALIKDNQGTILGRGVSTGANPVHGVTKSTSAIMQAIQMAMEHAGLEERDYARLVVGAGIAGLHLPSMQNALENWTHPFHDCYFTSDLHVALQGAFGNQHGGLIILGTGFSAAVQTASGVQTVGGYGFPFNATGSGSWLGLKAIEAALSGAEGIGRETDLTRHILQHQSPVELAQQLQNAPPHVFGQYAPLVSELAQEGDAVALAIMHEASQFLARVIARLQAMGAPAVTLVGGVSEMLSQWLPAPVRDRLCVPLTTPEDGACAFALQQFAARQNTQEM
ncbi:BadF/BadG/BcrA/BcrD ATPase family protein [Alteromonas halophila]|uniref:ATPase n=1 Tax=Alteromonas halophila TaxID=516698 RepID=A0A918JKM5_9ALTE|nr:BadF/BadG/BcrA/BcrD ATPase family protein [Alteromonas halophila]GGW84807.1 ATPase [Alteromonas halophila]